MFSFVAYLDYIFSLISGQTQRFIKDNFAHHGNSNWCLTGIKTPLRETKTPFIFNMDVGLGKNHLRSLKDTLWLIFCLIG